ncbi:prepilin-type N-terminal cleavage/methylation domain-containing protein [Neobacillus sp. NPDC058068]|uniref:prepilin-type N-terminal cleavage/methylation domain-containing protein n=1 Tax=Neobacillus sp. NPDC058068 TaxID=3346325 RepID=UPI0036DEA08B
MEIVRNEKGVTLIEILISIVILSIIFLSIMRFFPQMGLMNQQNENKSQAINTAKGLLIDWQESNKVKTFIANDKQTIGFITNVNNKDYYTNFNPNPSGTDYIFTTIKNSYEVTIKIKKSPIEKSNVYSVHLIVMQLKNKNGNVVAETYGYVKR